MAMQKIERKSFGDETRVKLEKEGDILEGYYQGAETFDHKGKPLTKHRFKDENGKTVSILGSHQLNEDLPKVPVGSFTRVTYEGQRRTKRGTPVNNYSIEFEENAQGGL
jgi:hypothetical protein